MKNKDEHSPGRKINTLMDLPQELIPKIACHLNVNFIKKLMRCHSSLRRRLQNDFSLWKYFSYEHHSCVDGYINEIKHRYMLRRNICKSRNELCVDFETKQSDVTFMQMGENRVACSSDDQTIKMFEIDGRLVRTFIGHKGGVWTFMFNDKHLVSGSTDKTARIWDLKTGCTTSVLVGHKSTVRCLKIHSDYIVTGSRDSEIRVWNFKGVCLNVLKGHTQSVRCMDIDANHLVSGSYDGTVALWDYRNGRLVRYLKPHTLRVYSVTLSSTYVASSGLDANVYISTLNGKLLCSYRIHRSIVAWLKFINDRYLLSSGADGILCKWDVLENRLIYKIEESGSITAQGVIGDLLVVGTSKEVKVYDLPSGTFVRTLFSAPYALVSKVEVSERCISIGYFSLGVCRLLTLTY